MAYVEIDHPDRTRDKPGRVLIDGMDLSNMTVSYAITGDADGTRRITVEIPVDALIYNGQEV